LCSPKVFRFSADDEISLSKTVFKVLSEKTTR